MGLENHQIPAGLQEGGVRMMAMIAARMAAKIRATMPSLKQARTILCVENNVIWIVDTFNKALNEMTDTALRRDLGPYTLVHLNKAYAKTARGGVAHMTGEPASDPNGLLSFDLNTSRAYKALMAEHVKALMADDLLHWHRDLVSSATPDTEVRANLLRGEAADRSNLARLRENLGVRPAPLPSQDRFDAVIDEYDRVRMRGMFLAQFKNVAYKTMRRIDPRTLDMKVSKTITGKIKGGDKDDLYMALTIGLMGALHALSTPAAAAYRF